MSALFTQCPGNTVQTGTGKVDPARKFKCTTAARDYAISFFPTTYNGFNPSFRLHGTFLTVLDGMILTLTRSARVKQTQTCFYSFSHNDLNWPLIEYVFPIQQGKCI